MNDYLDFAKQLADKAGKIMLDNFVLGIATTWKEDITPLTVADTKINQLVIDEVKTFFPGHGVLGEESAFGTDQNMLWVVDPIDGTAPYSQGIPTSTFSLALVEGGQSIIAVILDPFSKRKYFAAKDNGAYLNGKQLSVNDQDTLGPRTYIDLGGDYKFHGYDATKIIANLAELNVRITKNNSVVYNTLPVATGHHAATIYTLGHPWDGAAISLLVSESGGTVTDLKGNERHWNEEGEGFIASNGVLHNMLLEIVNRS